MTAMMRICVIFTCFKILFESNIDNDDMVVMIVFKTTTCGESSERQRCEVGTRNLIGWLEQWLDVREGEGRERTPVMSSPTEKTVFTVIPLL